jgi:hypothetical protein
VAIAEGAAVAKEASGKHAERRAKKPSEKEKEKKKERGCGSETVRGTFETANPAPSSSGRFPATFPPRGGSRAADEVTRDAAEAVRAAEAAASAAERAAEEAERRECEAWEAERLAQALVEEAERQKRAADAAPEGGDAEGVDGTGNGTRPAMWAA